MRLFRTLEEEHGVNEPGFEPAAEVGRGPVPLPAESHTFAVEFDVPISADAIAGHAIREFVPFFGRFKYQLTAQSPTGLTLTRRYLSGGAFFVGLLLVPMAIGLLIWIFARRTQIVNVTFTELSPGVTRILITGQGPPEIHEYAKALQEQASLDGRERPQAAA